MEVELMNMCMIENTITKKIVALDKIVKYGWEGLTFPGGHVEEKESFIDSVIREVKEETNLVISTPILKGIIQWVEIGERPLRSVGLLYYTSSFSGRLVEENREGVLSWMALKEFEKSDHLSKSMDICLDIYKGKYHEAILYFENGKYLKHECS